MFRKQRSFPAQQFFLKRRNTPWLDSNFSCCRRNNPARCSTIPCSWSNFPSKWSIVPWLRSNFPSCTRDFPYQGWNVPFRWSIIPWLRSNFPTRQRDFPCAGSIDASGEAKSLPRKHFCFILKVFGCQTVQGGKGSIVCMWAKLQRVLGRCGYNSSP